MGLVLTQCRSAGCIVKTDAEDKLCSSHKHSRVLVDRPSPEPVHVESPVLETAREVLADVIEATEKQPPVKAAEVPKCGCGLLDRHVGRCRGSYKRPTYSATRFYKWRRTLIESNICKAGDKECAIGIYLLAALSFGSDPSVLSTVTRLPEADIRKWNQNMRSSNAWTSDNKWVVDADWDTCDSAQRTIQFVLWVLAAEGTVVRVPDNGKYSAKRA